MTIRRLGPTFAARTFAMLGLLAVAACDPRQDAADTAPPPQATPPDAPDKAAIHDGGVLAAMAQRPELTTLVSAIETAGLGSALNRAGPFTVFAPDNAGFEKIPAPDREALARPEGHARLGRILGYHVVPGRLDAARIAALIQDNGGEARLMTIQGSELTVRSGAGGGWTVADPAGQTATITQSDLVRSNGVVHVVDTVLTPN